MVKELNMDPAHAQRREDLGASLPSSAHQVHHPHSHDETYYGQDDINLIDIWFVLVKHRIVIFGMTFLATAGSLVYALLVPPTYLVTISLFPPSFSDIQNLIIKDLYSITETEVYNQFNLNLKLFSAASQFLETQNQWGVLAPNEVVNTLEKKQILVTQFLQQMNIKRDGPITKITLQSETPGVTAELLNKYIYSLDRNTIQQLTLNINLLISLQVHHLKKLIDIQQSLEIQTQQNFINFLIAARNLASELPLKTDGQVPFMPMSVPTTPPQNDTSVWGISSVLHFSSYGSKALEAYLKVIKEFPHNTSFFSPTTTLKGLREKLVFLQSITIDTSTSHSVFIDQPAYDLQDRIKPKRKLIVSMGFMIGLMGGAFVALFLNFVHNARNKNAIVVS